MAVTVSVYSVPEAPVRFGAVKPVVVHAPPRWVLLPVTVKRQVWLVQVSPVKVHEGAVTLSTASCPAAGVRASGEAVVSSQYGSVSISTVLPSASFAVTTRTYDVPLVVGSSPAVKLP